MPKIYFSVEEARELLPTIDKKVRKLMQLNEEISFLSSIKVEYAHENIDSMIAALGLQKKYHKLLYEFYGGLEELSLMGGVVKDLKEGLIDFYTKLENKDVFLCWKVGEPELNYWHEIEAGYPGRKPVAILQKRYEQKLKRLR